MIVTPTTLSVHMSGVDSVEPLLPTQGGDSEEVQAEVLCASLLAPKTHADILHMMIELIVFDPKMKTTQCALNRLAHACEPLCARARAFVRGYVLENVLFVCVHSLNLQASCQVTKMTRKEREKARREWQKHHVRQ